MRDFIASYLNQSEGPPLRVLDFGSRDVNGTYRTLFTGINCEYIGLDMEDGDNVDLVPDDLYHWHELKDSSFDVIVSGQALEHCEYFWLIFKEFKRILKPHGLLCVIAPSSGPEHKHPYDCWRFFSDGFKSLCRYVNLECLESFTITNSLHDDGSSQWNDTILIARNFETSIKDICT